MKKTVLVVILSLMVVQTTSAQEWHSTGGDRWQIDGDPRPRLTIENYEPAVGDVILSVAKEKSVRGFFQVVTGSQTTHVNIIVPHPEDGRAVVLDVNRKVPVRLVEVKEFLRGRGEVAVRKRVTSLSEEQKRMMTEFAKDQLGKKYPTDKNLVSEIYHALPVIPEVANKVSDTIQIEWRSHVEKNDTWFCSQLVVATAQAGGLIDKKVNPSRIVPADLFHAENPNWDVPQKLWRR